ncbi:RNA polymerase sigma factor [Bradyrhizobium liaoningense]|uniref:RNA polymerase sigma factor n=1 Tax=Bradyrhizobium liaoningense TaxID=43992 RepID=UPI001BA9CA9F|nr:RNA polymerase sigma factor [Bradyrhizobium liaoningense]MBR0707985.1 RNA polymerase sigma factor [Bradyrhizobium liaoningense]
MAPVEVPNTGSTGTAFTKTVPAEDTAAWARCLDGDRDAFQQVVTAHLDELFAAAQRDISYHVAVGDLGDGDLTAEELVGETFLRAWRDRRSRPQSLGIRPWLLGLQYRVLMRIVRQEQLLRRLVSVSLEARAPEPPIYDDDEGFWEWFQPDDLVRWEDTLTDDAHPEPAIEALEQNIPGLSSLVRQVLFLRQVHRLSFAEIAAGLRISRESLSKLWREGCASLAEAMRRNAT